MFISRFYSTKKPKKSKPKKPIYLTIVIYGHGDSFQILPSFMDDQEEERVRDFVEYIKSFKKGGGR